VAGAFGLFWISQVETIGEKSVAGAFGLFWISHVETIGEKSVAGAFGRLVLHAEILGKKVWPEHLDCSGFRMQGRSEKKVWPEHLDCSGFRMARRSEKENPLRIETHSHHDQHKSR